VPRRSTERNVNGSGHASSPTVQAMKRIRSTHPIIPCLWSFCIHMILCDGEEIGCFGGECYSWRASVSVAAQAGAHFDRVGDRLRTGLRIKLVSKQAPWTRLQRESFKNWRWDAKILCAIARFTASLIVKILLESISLIQWFTPSVTLFIQMNRRYGWRTRHLCFEEPHLLKHDRIHSSCWSIHFIIEESTSSLR